MEPTKKKKPYLVRSLRQKRSDKWISKPVSSSRIPQECPSSESGSLIGNLIQLRSSSEVPTENIHQQSTQNPSIPYKQTDLTNEEREEGGSCFFDKECRVAEHSDQPTFFSRFASNESLIQSDRKPWTKKRSRATRSLQVPSVDIVGGSKTSLDSICQVQEWWEENTDEFIEENNFSDVTTFGDIQMNYSSGSCDADDEISTDGNVYIENSRASF